MMELNVPLGAAASALCGAVGFFRQGKTRFVAPHWALFGGGVAVMVVLGMSLLKVSNGSVIILQILSLPPTQVQAWSQRGGGEQGTLPALRGLHSRSLPPSLDQEALASAA